MEEGPDLESVVVNGKAFTTLTSTESKSPPAPNGNSKDIVSENTPENLARQATQLTSQRRFSPDQMSGELDPTAAQFLPPEVLAAQQIVGVGTLKGPKDPASYREAHDPTKERIVKGDEIPSGLLNQVLLKVDPSERESLKQAILSGKMGEFEIQASITGEGELILRQFDPTHPDNVNFLRPGIKKAEMMLTPTQQENFRLQLEGAAAADLAAAATAGIPVSTADISNSLAVLSRYMAIVEGTGSTGPGFNDSPTTVIYLETLNAAITNPFLQARLGAIFRARRGLDRVYRDWNNAAQLGDKEAAAKFYTYSGTYFSGRARDTILREMPEVGAAIAEIRALPNYFKENQAPIPTPAAAVAFGAPAGGTLSPREFVLFTLLAGGIPLEQANRGLDLAEKMLQVTLEAQRKGSSNILPSRPTTKAEQENRKKMMAGLTGWLSALTGGKIK